MNKTNVESELKKFLYIRKLATKLPFIVIFLVFVAWLSNNSFFEVVCMVVVPTGIVVEYLSYYLVKIKITKDIAEVVIDQYIDDLVYDHMAPLVESTIKKVYLALPRYSDMRASDHIIGTYNGRSIEIADIHLVRRLNDSSETVFLGPFFKIETSKKISSPLTISTNKKEIFINNIKTENVTFNEIFNIYCKDLDEPYSILTDEMMERMMTFRKDKLGSVHFCFATDGYLYCAIDERRDRFELKMNQMTIDDISEDFDRDIRYFLSLIDELIDLLEEQENNMCEDIQVSL